MECNKCKQKISEDQKFCTYCGTRIKDLSIDTTTDFDSDIDELKSAVYSLNHVKEYTRNSDDLALKVENQLISHIKLLKTKIINSLDEIFVGETYKRVEYLKGVVNETAKKEGLLLNNSSLNHLDVSSPSSKESKAPKKPSFIPNSTIAVLLTFAVVLTVVSSFILLVTLWDDFGWIEKEAFIFIQVVALIGLGHFVFKSMQIYYSGLALITLGAFCTYLTTGIIVYEFTTYGNEFVIPEINLSLDLNYFGWIILFVPSIVIWGTLSYFYKGKILTLGTGLGIIVFSGLLVSSFKSYDSNWGFVSVSITAAALSYFSKYLIKWNLQENARFVFWGGQIVQILAFVLILSVTVENNLTLYPVSVILLGLTINSVIVFFDKNIDFYKYGVVILPFVAIVISLLESEILSTRWIGLTIGLFSLTLSIIFLILKNSKDAKVLKKLKIFKFEFSILIGAGFFAVLSPFWVLFSGLPDWTSSEQLFLIYSLLAVNVPIWILFKNIKYSNDVDLQKVFLTSIHGAILGLAIILIFDFYDLNQTQTTWLTFSGSLISVVIFNLILKVLDKNEFGLLGLAAIFSVYSIVISGWNDWGNWEPLLISGIYGVISIFIAYIKIIKALMIIGVFFLTVALGFLMGSLGLGFSERTIGWALQAFVLLWLSYFIDKSKIIPLGKMKIVKDVFYYAAKRLSWVTLFCAIFVLIVSFFSDDVFGEPWVLSVSITMAILGASYIGESFINQQEKHYYLGTTILLIGWVIQAIDWELGQAQIYAIPVGLYFLIISYLERQRLLKDDQDPEFGMPFFNQDDMKDPADLVAIGGLLDGLAIIVMGGTAFIQSMTQNPEWIYALLLGLEGIAFVIWSGVVKSKTLLFGGIIIFVANILYQITSLLLTFGGAIAGISIGVIILVAVLGVERFKDRIARLVDYYTA
ncbi:MAG: hypothetical protein CL751_05400 [Chloroflexi bacterium]|nr:hypothetical protein [Chloroflexota bacterium]